jgi:hypothetical protein
MKVATDAFERIILGDLAVHDGETTAFRNGTSIGNWSLDVIIDLPMPRLIRKSQWPSTPASIAFLRRPGLIYDVPSVFHRTHADDVGALRRDTLAWLGKTAILSRDLRSEKGEIAEAMRTLRFAAGIDEGLPDGAAIEILLSERTEGHHEHAIVLADGRRIVQRSGAPAQIKRVLRIADAFEMKGHETEIHQSGALRHAGLPIVIVPERPRSARERNARAKDCSLETALSILGERIEKNSIDHYVLEKDDFRQKQYRHVMETIDVPGFDARLRMEAGSGSDEVEYASILVSAPAPCPAPDGGPPRWGVREVPVATIKTEKRKTGRKRSGGEPFAEFVREAADILSGGDVSANGLRRRKNVEMTRKVEKLLRDALGIVAAKGGNPTISYHDLGDSIGAAKRLAISVTGVGYEDRRLLELLAENVLKTSVPGIALESTWADGITFPCGASGKISSTALSGHDRMALLDGARNDLANVPKDVRDIFEKIARRHLGTAMKKAEEANS